MCFSKLRMGPEYLWSYLAKDLQGTRKVLTSRIYIHTYIYIWKDFLQALTKIWHNWHAHKLLVRELICANTLENRARVYSPTQQFYTQICPTEMCACMGLLSQDSQKQMLRWGFLHSNLWWACTQEDSWKGSWTEIGKKSKRLWFQAKP